MKKCLFLPLLILIIWQTAQAQVVKVACIGNSITYGDGIENRDRMSYPAQLQTWLGPKYDVRNFGVSGATLLKKGDYPYWQRTEYKAALEFNPDIVIIKLGTNDSKLQNWKFADEFIGDYTDLIDTFKALSSKPRILVALPVPVFVPEKWGIRDSVVRDQIIPKIKQVAKATKSQYIDLYTPLLDAKSAFPDDVHPNAIGASMMVEEIYRALFHRDKMHSSGYLNTAVLPSAGFECRGEAAGWGKGKDWWSQFEDINQIGKTQKVDLVLLGNSITQGWGGEGRSVWAAAPDLWDSIFKPLNAANFGISGDRTQHIIWRIENGNFDQAKPKVIALEIGVNNFPYHTASEIAAGIKAITKSIQKMLPESAILLMGPLPTGFSKSDPARKKYLEVHKLIRELHNGNSIKYLPLDKFFVNSDGSLISNLFAPDGIHLTADGYRKWAEAMLPEITKTMK
ncbi:MAG: GDSL-type esterase/lipase family protein [Bacteroidota bacterium]